MQDRFGSQVTIRRTALTRVSSSLWKYAIGAPMPDLESSQQSIPLWNRVEAWIAAHAMAVVWVVVIFGFYLRFHRASGTYLNGDETQIMFPPLQHGLQQVYEAGLVFPYGPLLSFLLHFMSFFGSSELYLRMPSVLAGALTPFMVYLWVRDTLRQGGRHSSCNHSVLCSSDGSRVSGSAFLRDTHVLAIVFAVFPGENV